MDIIQQHLGEIIGAVVGLVGLAFWFGFWAKGIIFNKNAFKEVLKGIDSDRETFKEFMKSADSDRNAFREFMKSVDSDRETFKEFMKSADSDRETFKEFMKSADSDRNAFREFMKGVDSDRETFKEFMKEVRDDIKGIIRKLPPATVAEHSPLGLTDLGKSISDKLKASDWANETAPALVVHVAGKHPYEIQEFCLEYVRKEPSVSPDMNLEIQTCAFESGITKDDVLKVLAIALRDALLEDEEVVSSSPVPVSVSPT